MKKFLNVSLYAIVLTLMVGFSSCSKDDDDDTFTDPTSVLTTGKWKISDAEDALKPLSGDVASQVNATIVAALQFGTITSYQFKADGTFVYNGTLNGKWSLSSDKKTLTVKDSDEEELFIVEITEAKSTSMKFKVTYTKADLEASSDVAIQISLIPVTK